jgi:hypothetical protein
MTRRTAGPSRQPKSRRGPVGVPSTTGKRRETARLHANENALLTRQIWPLKTGTRFPTVGERWGRPAEVLRRNRRDLDGLTGHSRSAGAHKPKRIRRPPPVIERTPARAIRRCVLDRHCPAPGTRRLHERFAPYERRPLATFPRDDRYECQEDPLRLSRPWSVLSDLREGGRPARAPGGSVDSKGVGAIHAGPAPPIDPSHAASGGTSGERRGI